MAVSLVLKSGMFIDVAPIATADARARSSSLPAPNTGRTAFFSSEESYVSNLSAMWNQGVLPVTDVDRPKDTARFPQSIAASWQQTGECAAAAGERRPLRALNAGSVGHPLFCCKPCNFFFAGLCEQGNDCGFCHVSHAPSTSKLDTQNKQLLRQLGDAEREALLTAVVRSKLTEVCAGPVVTRLVREWCDAVGAPESDSGIPQLELPGVKSSQISKLLRNLRRINLHTACGLARVTCEGSTVASATQSLLQSLREAHLE